MKKHLLFRYIAAAVAAVPSMAHGSVASPVTDSAPALYARGVELMEKEEGAAAYACFRAAAEKDYAAAQYKLGVCYDIGCGVAPDYATAAAWYRKAAEQGYADAQFNLACCYELGQGVEQSISQAVYWYRRAAQQGDAQAQFNLADCYYMGHGVEQSALIALGWFSQAAEQGHVDAQVNLGIYYAVSRSGSYAEKGAVFWLRKAANQGDEEAARIIYTHFEPIPYIPTVRFRHFVADSLHALHAILSDSACSAPLLH